MPYSQGSVVIASDPFKSGDRPFVIVSNRERPFQGDAYTVVVMTTTDRRNNISLVPDSDVVEGMLNRRSYANPWALHILQHKEINKKVAQLSDNVMEEICNIAQSYIEHKS